MIILNSHLRRNFLNKLILILLLAVFCSTFFLTSGSKYYQRNTVVLKKFNDLPSLSDASVPIFEGYEEPLNVTDYGNLYENNQQVSLTSQEDLEINYYLDDVHDWEISKIETHINNIQDTREWVKNSDYSEVNTYRVNVSLSNIPDTSPPQHNYTENLNRDPTTPANIHNEIIQNNASHIRVHFSWFEIETNWDIVCFYDEENVLQYFDTGKKGAFFSPWIKTTNIKITMDSDGSVQWYGFDIDYYEYVNNSIDYYDSINYWGFNNGTLANNFGANNIENESAMYVSLVGNPYRTSSGTGYFGATYYENDFSEIFQNITIPRGQIIDGYISFDYYAECAMDSNENYLYCEINNKKIYSKGIGDIVDAGRRTWLSTGEIYLDLWSNTSNLFEDIQNNQDFNISVGIMSGASISYSGFDELFQQIFWFDNLSLVLTTLANSSQNDINLKLNEYSLNQGDQWGESELNITGTWDVNPVVLKVNTSSPSLSFDLDTYLYGYHESTSRIGQTTLEGVSFEILENGTVYWYFSHNFFMPSQYSDFEFIINKPLNWEFMYALDPTLLSRPFENGNINDSILKINKSNALFPGWWSFKARSSNYLDIENTKMLKQGEWTHTSFNTGDSTRIKTQVNYSGEIPSSIESTEVNLTISDPEGNQWYSEVKSPLSNGSVFFSELFFDALNTTGGQYDYTLFWSNGTSLGGLNSSFLILHQSSFSLIKPNDAISDFQTDAFIGDIIPVQIKLNDSENNNFISNAKISYNWTLGTLDFEEVGLGFYETILYTSELVSNGFYEILIESSKVGFLDYNLTLKINLREETNVQRLQSDYNIELHANSTIKFRYYSLLDDAGINGANIGVNISNPDFYSIENPSVGEYNIEFNTSFTDNLGIIQLNFNFSAPSFEPQMHIYQFEIVEQSVNITAYVDNVEIQQNSIIELTYMEEINISTQARALIDDDLLMGGNFTWKINTYEQTLNEYSNFWYNTSIQINPSIYSPGLNLIGIWFEMEKYQTDIFYFQLLVYEQPVNLSLYVNSHQISEDQLVEVMFKQNITISARAYGNIDFNYIEEAYISWNSESYAMNFIEYGASWYNLSLTLSATNFSSGINTVSIKFEKQNYTTTYFSFQLLVREQSVQLNVSINSQTILENALIEVMFRENITIAAQAYAMGEKIFLSGGNITLIGEMFTFEFDENLSYPTWFTVNIVIDGAYFELGINTVSVKFEQANYSEAYFSFQFFITAETVNLSLYVNSQEIVANSLIEITYSEGFSLSLRALSNVEKLFLDGGSAIFVVGSCNHDFIQYANHWYNISVLCNHSHFDLGINSVYVRFMHPNYTSTTFYFQILVNQIEMNVNTIDFQDSIESLSGESLVIRINLTEIISAKYIESATISYSWEFGLGNFEEVGNGIYECELEIPDNIYGSFKVSLIISTENVLYKTTQSSFLLIIGEPEFPVFIIWIIILISAAIISVLGVLSLRSYVILPRRRKKEAELLSRTQKFKDIKNIQAIVAIHRYSGIPLYSKSYSILEKHKKELFSGFIQAIITVGEEMVGKREAVRDLTKFDDSDGSRTILELDFKYFYCLICDRQDLRMIFILNERASDRLKKLISDLSLGIMFDLSQLIENWDGAIHDFELQMPPIIAKYVELYYKDTFKINNAEYIARLRKKSELSSMEIRILNVIYSIAKSKKEFHLDTIFEVVHEKNQDLIIDAIETLLNKKIIIPSNK